MSVDLWSDLKNKEQENAIKHVDGPCLIIAGPGSGKTKVMVRRYLNLVLNNSVNPVNILLTTFTEKAADKLLTKVTNGLKKNKYSIVSEDLNIGTIHSFCARFLRKYIDEYPDDLKPFVSKGFRILTGDEQLLFIFQNLPSFGTITADEIPSLKGWNHVIKLSSFFNKCTEEGLNWKVIESFVDSLSDNNKNKDDLWQFGYAFGIYEDLLREKNVLDFSHLQTKFFEVINSRDKILDDVRKNITYLMIDEFQDTNHVQSKIFRLIGENHKNLMVVGDDDQSIYRFRGAVVENILGFEKYVKEHWKYADFEPMYLTKNYRSTPVIVKNSLSLIERNDHRFNKKLIANKTDNNYKFPVWFQGKTSQEEAELVASYIKTLINKKIIQRYSDVGILFRSVGYHATEYINIFKREHIPVEIRGGNNFFEDPLVAGVRDLFWSIYTSKEASGPDKNENLINNTILNLKHETEVIIEGLDLAIVEYTNDELDDLGIDDEDLKKLKKLRKIHLKIPKSGSILGLFYDLLQVNNLLTNLISDNTPLSTERMRGISQLSRFIYDFDNYGGRRPHPSEFLRYINALDRSQNIVLESERENDAVSIYTIHQAKGLEWPIVIIGSAIERLAPNTRKLEDHLYTIYERDEVIDPQVADILENRRVFYVGITRAKEVLGFATCVKYGDTKIERNVIEYMNELSEKPSDFYKQTSKGGKLPLYKIRGNDIEERVEKKIVSFTELSTYLRCPKQYLLLRDVNFATVQVGQLRYGSNIHSALEDIHKLYKDGKIVTEEQLNDILESNWISFGFRSPDVESKFKKGARRLIQEYYDNPEYNSNFTRTDDVEYPFTVELENCFLSGRIDLINKLNDKEVEVVDFKVGKTNDNEYLHKLQVQVYALALQLMDIPVGNMSVRYISKNSYKNFKVNDDELTETKNLVESIIDKINNNEFERNVDEHCNDCAFKSYCLVDD